MGKVLPPLSPASFYFERVRVTLQGQMHFETRGCCIDFSSTPQVRAVFRHCVSN
jgi:hypothetical protein